jgi:hypothetical protein
MGRQYSGDRSRKRQHYLLATKRGDRANVWDLATTPVVRAREAARVNLSGGMLVQLFFLARCFLLDGRLTNGAGRAPCGRARSVEHICVNGTIFGLPGLAVKTLELAQTYSGSPTWNASTHRFLLVRELLRN